MRSAHTSPAKILAAGSCLAAAVLMTPAPAGAAPAPASASASAGQHLAATLRGGTDGDPDGNGHADLTLYKKTGRVCASVTWQKIATPTAAHIHRPDGTVAVDLSGSVTGGAHCARNVRHRLIQRILDHPRRFYVNVHNATYPAGAIRGALHR